MLVCGNIMLARFKTFKRIGSCGLKTAHGFDDGFDFAVRNDVVNIGGHIVHPYAKIERALYLNRFIAVQKLIYAASDFAHTENCDFHADSSETFI